MDFESTPAEREEAIRYRLEAVADDFNEMVALIGHPPLVLEEANGALHILTDQLVRLCPFSLLGFNP